MATDPLLTTGELEIWLQLAPGELDGDPFATVIIAAASMLVRGAGSQDWTNVASPTLPDIAVPPRAKLIATLKAKTYYENPAGNISETTGPITERKIDDVVHNMTLTDAEQAILAELAGRPVPGSASGGLWIQPVGSGEMVADEDVYVTDQSGTDWMIPFVALDDHLYPAEQ